MLYVLAFFVGRRLVDPAAGAAFWGAVIISVVSFLIGRVVNPKRVSRAFAG